MPNIGLLSTPEPETDSGNDLFKNVLVDGFFFNPNWVIFEQHYTGIGLVLQHPMDEGTMGAGFRLIV